MICGISYRTTRHCKLANSASPASIVEKRTVRKRRAATRFSGKLSWHFVCYTCKTDNRRSNGEFLVRYLSNDYLYCIKSSLTTKYYWLFCQKNKFLKLTLFNFEILGKQKLFVL